MKLSLRLLIFVSLLALIPGAANALSQPTITGTIAFVGTNAQGESHIYMLDLGSGQMGQVIVPVSADADLTWHPDGNRLAFTTANEGYGILRSLRGCFEGVNICADALEVLLPFRISQLEWVPVGNSLFFQTDQGIKHSAPLARPEQITDDSFNCSVGLAVNPDPYAIFCADEDSAGNIQTTVYAPGQPDVAEVYQIGTYPGVTAYDVGPNSQAIVGTIESAGDSGFYAAPDVAPRRLVNYQIHIYDLEFNPTGTSAAIAGATSDSTDDGTLRDGDTAELYLYNPASDALQHIPGFTDATALTWSPDSAHILVILGSNRLAIYTPATGQITPIDATFPPGVTLSTPDWNPAESTLPVVAATSTPAPTATRATLPTFTPFPTMTVVPTATPGSPMGTGCDQALVGTPPVAVGDTAEVTQSGAAIRLRSGPALTATLIRELATGTRMKVLDGFYCAQGYRWWQIQIETDGQVGYLADSDKEGYWIQTVDEPVPTPTLSVSFYADAYTITEGNCTIVHWAVEGIKEVYFEETGVAGQGQQEICPTETTTYDLRIVRIDDSEFTQSVTITVEP